MNGFAVINKQGGMSSSDVVIKCRNALSKALGEKVKSGHMGTLDPMAEGILIVAFGNATRLFDFLLAKQKSYIATFVFGEDRDTADATGKVVERSSLPRYKDLADILVNFIGDIMQTPPKYSAVNVNGVRAYDMARAGKDFQLQPKKVNVGEISVIDSTLDGEYCKSVTLSIKCGGGTYIRSICTDVAKSLGVCAYMSALTRSECGGFDLKDSVTLNEFISAPLDNINDIKLIVGKIMPIISADSDTYFDIRNGKSIDCNLQDGNYAFEYDGKVCFIVEVNGKSAKSICFLQEKE